MTQSLTHLPEFAGMPNFMSVKDICELFHVDEKTVRRWIDNGTLQAIRVGENVIRIPKSAVLEMLTSLSVR